MNNNELKALLKENTNMSEKDIDRHIADGIMVYSNDEKGYDDFKEDKIAGLCDEDEIAGDWDSLDIVGEYRMDFCL